MPLALQAKLLRVLQEGEVEVVGGSRPQQVDVRVIAATHRDIAALTAEGKFRQDLFYRLNVVPIDIPPLRERPEDIPVLVRHFIRRLDPGVAITIDRGVDDALLEFEWPGNVRELRNVVERMLLLREGNTLRVSDLPANLLVERRGEGAALTRIPFYAPRRGAGPGGVGEAGYRGGSREDGGEPVGDGPIPQYPSTHPHLPTGEVRPEVVRV